MKIKRILKRIIGYFDLNKRSDQEPSNLIEYDLLHFNEDLDKAWEKVNALYNEILHKDNHWHLFYEGKFSTLRCSPQYKNEVEKFFQTYNIEWKYNGIWIDGSPTVEKYKNMFRDMFHAFSELAICLDEDDLFKVADRVCHCFFNHAHYMAKKHREQFDDSGTDPLMWEAEMMARVGIYRANYIGMLEATKRYVKLAKEQKEE